MIAPSEMASHYYQSNNSGHTTPGIQPSVKTILDLAWDSHQHIVRLYYLPTPNTNGFTTTHTLTYRHDQGHLSSPAKSSRRSTVSGNSINSCSSSPGSNQRRTATHKDDERQGAASVNSGSYRIRHLTRVSESERGIVHLARLRITSMIIATSSIPYLSHLVSLRLQGNQLTDLPLQIFRLPSLRELDVSQNRLTEISGLIGLLAPTLEELFLQSNRLQSLPQQLGRLRRLRLLDIADNHLGCIPVEVQRLVSESYASERRGLWRVTEESPPAQSPVESPIMTAGPGQGAINIVPNDEGGHDDDDYVQIRQGMKCWARGNRFWHVGVPWPSTATSSSLTTAMAAPSHIVSPTYSAAIPPLASSSSSLSSSLSSSSSNSPISSPFAYSGTPASALPLPTLNSLSTLPSNHSGINNGHAAASHGIRLRTNSHQFNDNRPSAHSRHQYHHLGSPPHPGQQLDRRGYSKDSYTSCPWTLSLADVCSQIVGEKLCEDPHYFCHTSSCVTKRTRTRKNKQHNLHQTLSPAASSLVTSSTDPEIEDGVEDCAVMMIPEWTIEQLGLYHLTELRSSLYGINSTEADDWAHDDFGNIGPDGAFLAQTNGPYRTTFSSHPRSHPHHALDQQPAPMQLTLAELEMDCEFCSVCQKRLYFPGLRWKGVGVMDERIVPLEWVACSVQCRAQAEREERRGGGGGNSGGNNIDSNDLVPSQTADSRESLSRDSLSEFGGMETTASWSPGPLTPRQFESGLSTRNSPALPAFASTQAAVMEADAVGPSAEVSPVVTIDNLARESAIYGLYKFRASRRRMRSLSL